MTSPTFRATVAAMFAIVAVLVGALLSAFEPRASLVAENLALRQQLVMLRRTVPRPRLRPVDRAFWVLLSRAWSRWTDELEWLREGEPQRTRPTLPQPPAVGARGSRRTRRERPSRHELLVGLKEHFEGAKQSDSGNLRPLKTRLVDVFVTKTTLDRALDVANALF